jgi:hypothetical protein
MKLMLDHEIVPSPLQIGYSNKILFIGSCFSQEIGYKMKELKFNVLQNPHGILFDPISISEALTSYVDNKHYELNSAVYLNDLWHSWQHHSSFSGIDKEEMIKNINNTQVVAHEFVNELDWLVISLGSAFHYLLASDNTPVANCHKAPAAFFKKELLPIDQIVAVMSGAIQKLLDRRPELRIILTVSPVRHIRDGLTENNHSKARLIEAVHLLISKHEHTFYFPAYELLIDVLRDYRFYKTDMVHPDEKATEYIFERFAGAYIEKDAIEIMKQVSEILKALRHRPVHTKTNSYTVFQKNQLQKILNLQKLLPSIDLEEEVRYFSTLK